MSWKVTINHQLPPSSTGSSELSLSSCRAEGASGHQMRSQPHPQGRVKSARRCSWEWAPPTKHVLSAFSSVKGETGITQKGLDTRPGGGHVPAPGTLGRTAGMPHSGHSAQHADDPSSLPLPEIQQSRDREGRGDGQADARNIPSFPRRAGGAGPGRAHRSGASCSSLASWRPSRRSQPCITSADAVPEQEHGRAPQARY